VAFFDTLTQNGIRTIHGSVDATCWAYGVLSTGEMFYFNCDSQSADLYVKLYDPNNDTQEPMEDPDWHGTVPESTSADDLVEAMHLGIIGLASKGETVVLGGTGDQILEMSARDFLGIKHPLWPTGEEAWNLFQQLLGNFEASDVAGQSEPMNDELFQRLCEAELRDMIS